MARRTKRQNSEYVTVYYGINPKTFTVESIWQQRDGTLVKSAASGIGGQHYPLKGRSAEHEILVVWHLTDIVSTPVNFIDAEFAKESRRKLEEKAAAMKKAAASEAENSSGTLPSNTSGQDKKPS